MVSTYNWSCVTGLALLNTDEPWMLLMIAELLSMIFWSVRSGSPASWIIYFFTSFLAYTGLTGMNLEAVNSLWRDRTMYFVFIEADIVALATLLRFDRVETLRLFDRSSNLEFLVWLLIIWDCVANSYALAGYGSSSCASFSTTSEKLTTSFVWTCFGGSLFSTPRKASRAALSSGNLLLTIFCDRSISDALT